MALGVLVSVIRSMVEARVEHMRLEVEEWVTRRRIPNIILTQHDDAFAQEVVFDVVRRVAFLPGKERLEVPADWWAHFKLRFFPRWWLRRWPAKMRTFDAVAYFPSLAVPFGDQYVPMPVLREVPCEA